VKVKHFPEKSFQQYTTQMILCVLLLAISQCHFLNADSSVSQVFNTIKYLTYDFDDNVDAIEYIVKSEFLNHKIDDCASLTERGSCTGGQDGEYLRWTYNNTSDKCTSFLYSGCNGNKNRFLAKNYCEIVCQPDDAYGRKISCTDDFYYQPDSYYVNPTKKLKCAQKSVNVKYRDRWTYNSSTNKCTYLIWHGCDEPRQITRNHFKSLSSCEYCIKNETDTK